MHPTRQLTWLYALGTFTDTFLMRLTSSAPMTFRYTLTRLITLDTL